MACAHHSRSRRYLAAAAVVAVVLLLMPAGAAATAAIDEYSLGPAGGQNQAPEDVQRDPDGSTRTDPVQLGVLGENEPAQSPLAAAGAIVWPGLGLALVLTVAIALAMWERPRRDTA